MTSVNRLALVPFVLAACFAVGLTLPDHSRAAFFAWAPVGMNLATAVAAAATAARFETSDRLFAPWAGLAFGQLLTAVNYVLRAFEGPLLVRNSITLAINIVVPWSLWLFVRAWRESGLALPMTGRQQNVWRLAGIALALVIGGYPLWQGLATAHTDVFLLISSLGDVAGFALLVPLALSALALRGGVLMYVWLFLACSQLGWMIFDIFLAVAPSFGMDPRDMAQARQVPRTIAVAFVLVAAIVQRIASARRGPEFDGEETAVRLYLRRSESP